jgi:thiol-disulfide isomerase/thioredoxin
MQKNEKWKNMNVNHGLMNVTIKLNICEWVTYSLCQFLIRRYKNENRILHTPAKSKSYWIFLFLVLCYSNDAISQKEFFEPVAIGQRLNLDIDFGNVINHGSSTAKLSEFRTDLLILDFWNRNCVSCIEGFPKLEALQNQFKGRVKVLLITSNTRDELKSLLLKTKNVKESKLTMILGDTVLRKLFPHTAEPYQVWVGKNDKVLATTSSLHINSENINLVLQGGAFPKQYIRNDELDFDSKVSLMIEGGGRQWQYLEYYSLIMREIKGTPRTSLGGIIKYPITGEIINGSLKYLNVPLDKLYGIAYKIPSQYTIVEDDDSLSFFHTKDLTRIKETRNYCYSYELVLRKSKLKQCFLFMQQDLERYFGFTAFSERHKLKCYILFRKDSTDRLKSKGDDYLFELLGDGAVLKNVNISAVKDVLLSKYIGLFKPPIVIDETGYRENVDIEFKCGLDNLEGLTKELATYGLGIRIEAREIECLVLKKNGFWTPDNFKR